MLSLLPPIAPPDAPAQPGWWPLAPGWWFLALILFFALMWGFSLLMQRSVRGWRRREPAPATRELALAALDELAKREPVSDREVAYRLNEILRAALFDSGAKEAWQPFSPVSDITVNEEAWHAFWQELAMRYRRPDTGDGAGCQREWIAVARGWLEQLPEGGDAAGEDR